MPKTIHQTEEFNATPHDIYSAFMDSAKHAEITGSPAKIGQNVGDKFTAHGGYCEGVNLELIPDQKIVQTWRASDWPKDSDSRITLLLKQEGDKTILDFTHEDIPDDFVDDIAQGWIDYYWTPLRDFLGSK